MQELAHPTGPQGHFDKRFAPLVEVFRDHLAAAPHGGACLSVYAEGAPVVDLWGGLADVTTGRPWRADTSVVMFSCTKSVATIVMLRLVAQGLVDLDVPISVYWPEFATNGKADVTLRHVMTHQAGLLVVDRPLSFDDVLAGTPIVEALVDQEPLWELGAGHAYHPITGGAILGEVVRRVTNRSLGNLLREDIAESLGLDVWVGLPPAMRPRVALTIPAEYSTVPGYEGSLTPLDEDGIPWRALTLNGAVRFPVPGVCYHNSFNDPRLWGAELPSSNGIATARGLAKLHASLVSDVAFGDAGRKADLAHRTLTTELLVDATRIQSEGPQMFVAPTSPQPVWATGFMRTSSAVPMLSESSFGHDGAGGGLCFADTEARLGFAYLTNRTSANPSGRSQDLVAALRACL